MAVKTQKRVKQLNAKLDNTKRINTDELSFNTLKMMDKSILNFRKGKISKPINFKKLF